MDDNKFRDQTPAATDAAPVALDDERRLKVLSPGMLVFKRFIRNKLAIVGSVIIIFMFLFSFLGGLLMPYSESQVFKDYETMQKEYAAVTENEDLRYLTRDGSNFDTVARSSMILAVTKGESSFTSGGNTFGLIVEGEDFYRVTETTVVASGKGIKGKYKLDAQNGAVLPSDFDAAFTAAYAAGESSFTTADGVTYTFETTKVQATVYEAADYAMVSKTVYAGDMANDYDFRYAAEKVMQTKASGDFTVGETAYHLAYDEGAGTITNAAGDIVASAGTFVVKEIENGTNFPDGFEVAVQAAINDNLTTFEVADEDGTLREYSVERKNKQYLVRREEQTYQISIYHSPSAEHWLGTDGNGMDILTRLMYGGRISLMIGFIVVLMETVLGVILGGVAGYFGGWVDNLLMRVVDIFNCIPSYPIFIILAAIMDAQKVEPRMRLVFLMIIMGVLGWPGIARIVRGQILSLREQEFMTATEATGLSVSRRIFRHLVPNVIPQLIVIDTMTLGGIILTEATLSFLGLGVKYPFASWGSIINAVSNVYVMTNYLFVWIPAGILILLTVLGFNFIGDGLRDAFDPKMKR